MEAVLQNGRFRATVTTQGGELISFQDGEGTEYLWQGDPAVWAGRDPILFPIVGALRDGKVRFPEGEYAMARHGFARNSQFTLAQRGEDFAVLELTESPETLDLYPYPFRLRVTHRLTERGFETAYAVKNTGAGTMLYCIGGHTAFNCPLHPGERFEDYRLVFDQAETGPSAAVGRPGGVLDRRVPKEYLRGTDTLALRHGIFDEADTLIFSALRSRGVSLVHRDTGRGLRMDFHQFPMLGVWTMPGKNAPYLCIEPWQGCAAFADETGWFQDKPCSVALAPGEERTLAFSVEVL